MIKQHALGPALDYLEETSKALELPEIDTARPLAQQRQGLLIAMGAKLTKSQGACALEPYRVFWSVFCHVMRIQDDTQAVTDAPEDTALPA